MIARQMLLGDDAYQVGPSRVGGYADPALWRVADGDGRWSFADGAISGEWLQRSPSLFLKSEVHGDFIWRMRVRLLAPDPAFVARFRTSAWGSGGRDPADTYNFNFWLCAGSPDGGDFLEQYLGQLGSGANGMGDDHWRSYFSTVVRGPEGEWMRLRRSPGYRKVCDAQGVVPVFRYGVDHEVAFAIVAGRVRAYVDHQRIYDHLDPDPLTRGHLGVCVWLCAVRFHDIAIHPCL
ncbi:MAG: hypothetical protein H0W83_11310 [Planctomycetes bacterium]|nr:hypothetical protein [Planctomycetota bacterium]